MNRPTCQRLVIACAAWSCLFSAGIVSVWAQNNGNGQNGNGQNNNGQAGGILIDADGVVRDTPVKKGSAKLTKKQRQAFAAERLNADLNRPTPMRVVSLIRLESALRRLTERAEPIPVEMQYLAGLQRIDYVFVDPESRDLVIAGPAEGFAPLDDGRMVGMESGRPVFHLDDLIIALQAGYRRNELGCSIDPRQQNLAALQNYLRSNSFAALPDQVKRRFPQMAKILGMQDVRVWGVPPDSHYAYVLVEADYRMKRIALGIDKSDVKGLNSYLALLTEDGNSMQRWWFTPLYDAFLKSPDGNGYEFAGQRAQLMSEEEVLNAAGQRSSAASTRDSIRRFGRQFTEKLPELVESTPVFAELQNLIDLAVLASLLQSERLTDRVGWTMSQFLQSQQSPSFRTNVPREVQSIANFREGSRGLILGLVGGGVKIDGMKTISQFGLQIDQQRRIPAQRTAALAAQVSDEQAWWWDVTPEN